MTAKDNTTLVRMLYDAFNNHQSDPAWFDKAAAIIAEDFEGINPRGVSRGGSVGLNTHIGSWIIAFPGCNVEVTNVFSTKDQTVVEFIGRGTHTGPYQAHLETFRQRVGRPRWASVRSTDLKMGRLPVSTPTTMR